MAYGNYPRYPSYLDFVFAPYASAYAKIPRAVAQVETPHLTDEGVVRSDAGEGGVAGSPMGEGPATVGQAMDLNQNGMLGSSAGAFGGKSNNLTLGLNLATLMGLPAPVGLMFSGTGKLSSYLSGFNIDPATGMRVGSAEFKALAADPIYSQYIDLMAPPIAPFSLATTIAPQFGITPGSPSSVPGGLHASESGFVGPGARQAGIAPTGPTPPNMTNFAVRAAGDDPEGPGGSPGGAPGGAAPGGTGGSSPSGGEGGQSPHTGGEIQDRNPRSMEERVTALQGEYVIQRGPSQKYRKLLEAINQDRPADIKRHASNLKARMA